MTATFKRVAQLYFRISTPVPKYFPYHYAVCSCVINSSIVTINYSSIVTVTHLSISYLKGSLLGKLGQRVGHFTRDTEVKGKTSV